MNKLDRERASFERTLDDLKDKFGAGVAPLELPIGEEAEFRGVVDLLPDEAVTYYGATATGTTGPIPADMETEEHAVHDALIEGIVVADDDLMERYLGDEKLSRSHELEHALAKGIAEGSVFPVLCGSATKLVGVDRLAHFIAEEGPAPDGRPTGQPAALRVQDDRRPLRRAREPLQGAPGHRQARRHLVNGRTVSDERLHQITTMRGKEQDPVDRGRRRRHRRRREAHRHHDRRHPRRPRRRPSRSSRSSRPSRCSPIGDHGPKAKGDEDKLANALHRLQDEDPAIRVERNPETHQTLLWGMGETHLGIALEKLERKFGVQVDDRGREGRVPRDDHRHGRGRGQVQEADRRPRPVRGRVPARRAARARRGLRVRGRDRRRRDPPPVHPRGREGVARDDGDTAACFGFPVVDVKVTCFDGKYHSVDSSEMSFKMAGSIGFKEAMAKAAPILLEPISELVVVVPRGQPGRHHG